MQQLQYQSQVMGFRRFIVPFKIISSCASAWSVPYGCMTLTLSSYLVLVAS